MGRMYELKRSEGEDDLKTLDDAVLRKQLCLRAERCHIVVVVVLNFSHDSSH